MFDTVKLEASQRALAQAVDVLRWRAAAEASVDRAAGPGVSRRPWHAVSPEGLCVALRACVDNARTESGRNGGVAGTGVGVGVGVGGGGGGGANGVGGTATYGSSR